VVIAHDRLSEFVQHLSPGRAHRITPSEERLLAAAPVRWRARVDRRELLAHGLLGTGFAVACAIAIAASGAGTPAIGIAIALVLAFALLSGIEFQAGSGYTDPTQLVFVPMLFLVPPVWAPLLVAVGLTLALAPSIASGRLHISRVLAAPGNAWYALGPALVFTLADVGAASLGDWPIYVLALAAQFAVDYAAGAIGERLTVGVAPQVQLRVMLPVWRIDVLLSAIGLMAALAARGQPYAFLLVLPLGALMANFAREHRARIDQAIELSSAYRNTALLLGDVVGDDDAYTGAHSRSVVTLAVAVARELRLDDDELRLVELGALLHDVGKVAIPKDIINKPGPLDESEWAVVRSHTIVGQQMLDRIGGALSDVGEVVRCSHEWFNGAGYPDCRAGTDIPLASRIVSVADAYSAMTTDRPYRDALPEAESVRRLLDGSGSQFDPDVVDAFVVALVHRGRPRSVAPARVSSLV
jgi:putative nucleotidyltransferase with HDIG domain